MPTPKPESSTARLAELERRLAQAEEALQRSETERRATQDYFGKSFHASPALMAIVRVDNGRILEANDPFLKAAGYTREEVLGRTHIDLGIWPKPEMREMMMDQLRRTGSVRNYEAVFHTKSREARYVLLSADIFDQGGTPYMLITAMDISERRRREQLQEATYEISRVMLAGGDLNALFAEVHRIITGLMPARNFYIALLNPDDGMIHFPYFVDEIVPSAPPRRPANGLTEHVLSTGQPVLVTQPELHLLLSQHGSYIPLEKPAAVRLAVPLLIGNKAIGVIAVQDYEDAQAYTEEAKRLLLFVADQAAGSVQRRLSETRQRESQEFFLKTFQTTPAVMIIARFSDGHILEANAGFEQASGYSRMEALGRNTFELGLWHDPVQRDRFLEILARDGRVRDFEGVFRTKQGAMRYLILNADAFEMHGTKCMLTVGVDITDRRRREQVQEATYQISQAVLAGSDLMTLFAEVHRIIAGLMSARNFYVALLSPDGSLLSFPYFVDETIAPPPPRKPGFGLTEYVLHTGRPLLTSADELTVIRKEHSRYAPLGKPAALWLGVPLNIDGRAIGVIAVQDYRDTRAYDEEDKRLLTFVAGQTAVAVQRRQVDAALQRAEAQYRSIFENALEGLYITSADGRFHRANPALARMVGYSTSADLIRAINDVGRQIYANPNRRAEFMELIQHSNEVTDFESEILRPDGTRIWISESVRVVRNAAGEVQQFEGVAIDITAQREAARVLREAKEAADAANRAKSQFLASMSHELRTPLNGILGYTQILRRDAAMNDRQRSGITIIQQSADHLLALINDVLDLAKIEAHKLELHPAEFDLPEFAQSIAEFFAPRAREKNLLLETAFSPGLPRVVVSDAQRLRQVIFNLISNAIKFTSQGGVVFSVERPGENVRFSVSDSGPGISDEDQHRLFEPFAQLGDQSQRVGGTGLGLNVSRSILEQMGSRLMVESRTGWGTRFWFDLHLPEAIGASLKPRPPSRRIVGYEGERRRVLVADDHEPNRAVLVDLLEPLGFVIETANDGQEAIDAARALRPDLIFLDLRMPRVDGLAAARALQEMFAENLPCLIGISASAHEAQRQAALAAGCVAFLAKPFRDEDLFGLMERHLGLAWRYSDHIPSPESAAPFPVLPIPPSPAAASAIYDLASKGDVLGVRNYAQQLAASDARLAPFAQNIIDLAGRFKMKAIRSFVARYREPAAPAVTPPPET